jgi:hypothetical protein
MNGPNAAWPRNIASLAWPATGITYSYEHRGYIKPEKLERWLAAVFAPGQAKSVVCTRFD